MIDYQKALEATSSPSKTCRLAVEDLKTLKRDIANGANLRFNTETYHTAVAALGRVECVMCIAGAVVRGQGVPDDANWSPRLGVLDKGIEDEAEWAFNNRMEFLSDLRTGNLWAHGWKCFEEMPKKNLAALESDIEDVARDFGRPTFEDHDSNIDGYIKLYTAYAEYFEKEEY